MINLVNIKLQKHFCIPLKVYLKVAFILRSFFESLAQITGSPKKTEMYKFINLCKKKTWILEQKSLKNLKF